MKHVSMGTLSWVSIAGVGLKEFGAKQLCLSKCELSLVQVGPGAMGAGHVAHSHHVLELLQEEYEEYDVSCRCFALALT